MPKSILSPDFRVLEDGQEVTLLDASAWRERAEVEIAGATCRLYREGLTSGAFVIEYDGVRLASATKPSAFRSAFDVDVRGRRFTLRKLSMWKRGFGLYEGGVPVGTIEPAKWYSKRSIVNLPTTLPLPARVFIFWLVTIVWRRDAAAAAGS
ncbi:MAG: hypothetical protein WEB88_12505 [Gemmatimonadota bacterium]